jgi:hypothetical protein
LINCETSQAVIPGDLSGVAEGEDGSEAETRDPQQPGFRVKPGMTDWEHEVSHEQKKSQGVHPSATPSRQIAVVRGTEKD